MPQSPRWRSPAPSSWRRRSPCTPSSCTRGGRSSYTSSPPSTRPTRSSTPRGSELHGEVTTCSSFCILFFNSFRTNVSLGSDELFYKGASPFQYNLDSRNISLIEVKVILNQFNFQFSSYILLKLWFKSTEKIKRCISLLRSFSWFQPLYQLTKAISHVLYSPS